MHNLTPYLSFADEFYTASISINLDKIFAPNHDFQKQNEPIKIHTHNPSNRQIVATELKGQKCWK